MHWNIWTNERLSAVLWAASPPPTRDTRGSSQHHFSSCEAVTPQVSRLVQVSSHKRARALACGFCEPAFGAGRLGEWRIDTDTAERARSPFEVWGAWHVPASRSERAIVTKGVWRQLFKFRPVPVRRAKAEAQSKPPDSFDLTNG
jgi:hypothetical protein